jgi:hypothetical protein
MTLLACDMRVLEWYASLLWISNEFVRGLLDALSPRLQIVFNSLHFFLQRGRGLG